MARRILVPLLSALMVTAAGAALAQAVPAHLTAALAHTARPAADVGRDAARQPAELLAFAEVKPGQKVADFIMGGGYFTRILSAAVGPKGQVHAYQPDEFIKYQASYGENQTKVVADYKNVTSSRESLAALDLPDGLDLVFTVQNYHDLHLSNFPKGVAQTVNAEVFKSLKPGGLYVIVDHVAAPGSGLEAATKVHRIEPSIVRQEVEAAGFRFEGESPLLRDSADPHTASVFDPSIRGKTDQFAMKFRKPR
ncbi:class I SAM-dependent methyltransferase [Phenylobacterium sp. J426]|uniref:class I SAM-dependent methyltransferase n=1 Tax=Phenylobacterium sp. J426 TaxID=2898439 RepID=UPI00215145E9|nr:class I SAM-dependent methyltransferase [Phenylobacterium sp. J426]MCR5872887.1 class I SAM-dependent methyltransferase [Phenylobacterium sp. J426]